MNGKVASRAGQSVLTERPRTEKATREGPSVLGPSTGLPRELRELKLLTVRQRAELPLESLSTRVLEPVILGKVEEQHQSHTVTQAGRSRLSPRTEVLGALD